MTLGRGFDSASKTPCPWLRKRAHRFDDLVALPNAGYQRNRAGQGSTRRGSRISPAPEVKPGPRTSTLSEAPCIIGLPSLAHRPPGHL